MKLSVLDPQQKTNFLVSLCASQLAALGLSLLLFVEQQRSLKPSDLGSLYLIASTLCDFVYVTMPVKTARQTSTSHPVFFRCIIHLAILILESCTMRPAFSAATKDQSPEELYGVLNRVLFTWINPILFRGYKNALVDIDLPSLSRDIKPDFTRNTILQTWSWRG
jgi:ATP-binding cassette subfamily C (CFTR/MRP) protein 1